MHSVNAKRLSFSCIAVGALALALTLAPALFCQTATDATAVGFTVTAALALTPSLVAVIWDVPEANPVTTPEFETDATLPFALVQVMLRPVSMLPLASRSVAVASVV